MQNIAKYFKIRFQSKDGSFIKGQTRYILQTCEGTSGLLLILSKGLL